MSPLEKTLSQLLDRRHHESRLRQLKASPPGSVDLSSNDFLSLSTSPELKKAYIEELQNPPFHLGSTGSRLLDGNSEYAEALEKKIAAFHGAPAGLLTNSGFDANVSIFSCLPQPGDVIIYDELIHASVHDGMRQSRAGTIVSFSHNCVKDLRRRLEECLHVSKGENIFIAVESVYSMEGDIAPLKAIVELVEPLFPDGNAHIIVDEAHSNGVYGSDGRGLVSDLRLENRIFARLHTFGKALACNGSIILCSPVTRLYLINYARPLIYTTFMSHPSLVAINSVYQLMMSGQTTSLANRLFQLISILHIKLQLLREYAIKLNLPQESLSISTECPKSPIFALVTSHPRELAKHCQDAGFVVRAVVPPTVPVGTERVRVCLHAGNTEGQVERFVEVVRGWVELKAKRGKIAEREEGVEVRAKL